MSQSLSLGVRRAGRGIGKGEKLDLRPSWNGEIELPGVAFCPIGLANYREGQHLGVEGFGALIIRADDRDMMEGLDSQSALRAAL